MYDGCRTVFRKGVECGVAKHGWWVCLQIAKLLLSRLRHVPSTVRSHAIVIFPEAVFTQTHPPSQDPAETRHSTTSQRVLRSFKRAGTKGIVNGAHVCWRLVVKGPAIKPTAKSDELHSPSIPRYGWGNCDDILLATSSEALVYPVNKFDLPRHAKHMHRGIKAQLMAIVF